MFQGWFLEMLEILKLVLNFMLDLSQVTSFTTTNDKLDKISIKPSVKFYQDNIMALAQ